ncbi:MAG TPA: DUF4367 domain-containing protein [Candidatus Bariatricus faecipullorum]|nr:DUF4367 domain-containing protein [Candidatus Bariatricus faecipullorum]
MKNEQEKVKKLMQEELEREAEKIRAEVEADESLRNLPFPDGMDGELQKKIEEYEKNKAAVEMLSEEDQEALRLGRELQMLNVKENEAEDKSENGENGSAGRTGKTVRFRRKKRTYVLLAFVAVLVLAMGMTAIGGQPFVSMIREQILGDRNMVQIDSDNSEGDETIVNSGVDEEELAYQQIEEEFGFVPVRLNELPDGMEFEEYTYDKNNKEILLLYNINGNILEYRIYPNFRNKSIGYDVEDELLDEFTLTISDVGIHIQEYQIKENSQKVYMANFQYKDTYYILRGGIPKESFEGILKNLKFF